MALFGKVSEDYTRTGKGGLTSLANTLSFIPLVRSISWFKHVPIVGGLLSAFVGYIDTAWEAARWAFQGKFASAATVLAAGAVSNTVNALPGPIWWGVNAISGVTTGASVGTHARAATETLIGSVTGALGMKPTVLNSYPAAIGGIASAPAMGGKDNFRDKIAAERGLTRTQMDARADQAYVNMAQGNNALGA
jgi:hypothetical protein